MKILVLNSGSSSLKYQVIDMDTEEMLVKGYYERIGQGNSFLTHTVNGVKHKFEHYAQSHEEAISFVINRLLSKQYGVISNLDEISAIGHRVVHGGEKFTESVLITDEVIEGIRECIKLAPLHNPSALLGIEACMKLMPDKKMIAVFDTAFHQTMPPENYIYPIAYKYYEKYKIRKYGFHGTSHKFVANRCAEIMEKDINNLNIITCHLGQGASICAVKGGKSINTSMGLTPLGGISMGTRSGDLDPSIITYLMEKENLSPKQIDNILNKESGVYGISEISVDFRDIEAEAVLGNESAILALDNFAYLVASYIGRYAVSLGGIDAIVFTAGVGEKGPESRENICRRLEFMGVNLDLEKNKIRNQEIKISKEDSKIEVHVIPTNEELIIARDTLRLVHFETKS